MRLMLDRKGGLRLLELIDSLEFQYIQFGRSPGMAKVGMNFKKSDKFLIIRFFDKSNKIILEEKIKVSDEEIKILQAFEQGLNYKE